MAASIKRDEQPFKGGVWGGFAPPAKNRGVWGAAPPSQKRKNEKPKSRIFEKQISARRVSRVKF